MTIQDLGSIGELVAAIATLLTLIYLAIQIRQNTKQLRFTSSTTLWEDMNTAFDPVYMADNLKIYHKGLTEEPLEPHEKMAFMFFSYRVFSHFYQMHKHVDEGNLDPEALDLQRGVIISLLASPGTRTWWKDTGQHIFPPEFSQVVSSYIVEAKELPETAKIK